MEIKRDKKVANLVKSIYDFASEKYPTYNGVYIGAAAKKLRSLIKQAKNIKE